MKNAVNKQNRAENPEENAYERPAENDEQNTQNGADDEHSVVVVDKVDNAHNDKQHTDNGNCPGNYVAFANDKQYTCQEHKYRGDKRRVLFHKTPLNII